MAFNLNLNDHVGAESQTDMLEKFNNLDIKTQLHEYLKEYFQIAKVEYMIITSHIAP